MLTFSKDQMCEAVVTLYAKLADGESEKEAMESMGLDVETFQAVKSAMFEARADEVRRRPTEHVYVQYLLDQEKNLRELTNMLGMFKFTRQYNAMVGAVRVRAEILDKVIEKGQQFGLIEKKPEEKVLRAGVLVANLSNADLKREIRQKIEGLNEMMRTFGDKDILEIDPGPTHEDPAVPARSIAAPAADLPVVTPLLGKRSRAASGKVHGGRRVVKVKLGDDGGGDGR